MEEQFILRVPPSVSERIDRLMSEDASTSDEIPLDLCFSEDGRSGTFMIGNEEFPASLLDLPAVVESFKTYDDCALVKTADIGQMIMVREPGDPAPNTIEYRHGLTPPMKDARKRRFRREPDLNPELVQRVERDLLNILSGGTVENLNEQEEAAANENARNENKIVSSSPTPVEKPEAPETGASNPTGVEPERSESEDSDDSISFSASRKQEFFRHLSRIAIVAIAMAMESSLCLKPVSFARFTKNQFNQFRNRRKLSCRIRPFRFGVICSKTSDYQDFQSYARPLRLLPADEVEVSRGNPSFTVSETRSLYTVKLQTCNLFGSGISDMNARVLICLIDEMGDSVLQTIPANLSSLDPEVVENGESFKFQRGSVDEFTFEGPKLGRIRAFWICLESGQWRVGGVSLWVVNPRGKEIDAETFCHRYYFEVDEILLGESSDLSMVELRPIRITELTDSDQISSSTALDLDRTTVSNEESMEEYANLKLSLLLYDAILILVGSSVFSFSLGENSAIAFFFGGTMGFLYLLLLQRSVDELQAPGSSSSENSNQILSGGLKIPVLSLALAIGLTVLASRGRIGGDPTAFAVTPKEIVVETLGFLVCKVAVVLAAFKPLKDGS